MTERVTTSVTIFPSCGLTPSVDLEVLGERLKRLQGHDERLFERIDQVLAALKSISERLVHLESTYKRKE